MSTREAARSALKDRDYWKAKYDKLKEDYEQLNLHFHEDGTTTFEPITQGLAKYFKCSYCGMIVNPTGCVEKLDYNFCPYCGKPVVGSEDDA